MSDSSKMAVEMQFKCHRFGPIISSHQPAEALISWILTPCLALINLHLLAITHVFKYWLSSKTQCKVLFCLQSIFSFRFFSFSLPLLCVSWLLLHCQLPDSSLIDCMLPALTISSIAVCDRMLTAQNIARNSLCEYSLYTLITAWTVAAYPLPNSRCKEGGYQILCVILLFLNKACKWIYIPQSHPCIKTLSKSLSFFWPSSQYLFPMSCIIQTFQVSMYAYMCSIFWLSFFAVSTLTILLSHTVL